MNKAIDPFDHSGEYGELVKEKLEDVIKSTSPVLIAKVIRKVLENLVITERLAEAGKIEISDEAKRRIMQKDYREIQAEVDRASAEFVASIVSREGG